MKRLLPIAITALSLLSGCHRQSLYVQSDYITYMDLASYQVESPDPRKECPDTGQRLFVRWSLRNDCYMPGDTDLYLDLRFCNGCEKIVRVAVTTASGYYIYRLYNEDFFDTGGIVAYQAHIVAAGDVIESWHHQVWQERIDFSDNDALPPPDFSAMKALPPAGDFGDSRQETCSTDGAGHRF